MRSLPLVETWRVRDGIDSETSVEDALKDAAQSLKVGSKLLCERMLAEQLGKGRLDVREAICTLQIKGLINSRPGDGSYIVNTDLQREASALSFVEERENMFKTLGVPRINEADTVRNAAESRSEERIYSFLIEYHEKNAEIKRKI